MHDNLNYLEGGRYLEAEMIYYPEEGTSLSMLYQTVRLFEVDGVYIYDDTNPLSYDISSVM